VSPKRLADLEKRDRQLTMVRLVLRIAVIVALLLGAYYVLPVGEVGTTGALIRLGFGLLVFLAVLIWQVRRIVRADMPELQAIEALALAVPSFLVIFAEIYLSMANSSASAFSEPLNRTGALYFAMTMLSTVGFGDITPKTDATRIVVSIQMVLDLVLIGAVARLLVTATKAGLSRSDEPSSESD
jgi:voltage-gated potassium channel